MGFLAGKRILVTGVLSNRSIAYGIARAVISRAPSSPSPMWATGSRNAWRNSRRSSAARSCCPATWPRTARSRRPSPNWAPTGTAWTAWCALYRFRPAREAIARRLPGRPVARSLPRGARHFGLQLPRHGQGRPAADAGPQRLGADADLPGRRARGSQLQHHGPGQGLAQRNQRALPGHRPGPARHPRQRHRPARSRPWPPAASRTSRPS